MPSPTKGRVLVSGNVRLKKLHQIDPEVLDHAAADQRLSELK
mgnify:CR=1 FL=1